MAGVSGPAGPRRTRRDRPARLRLDAGPAGLCDQRRPRRQTDVARGLGPGRDGALGGRLAGASSGRGRRGRRRWRRCRRSGSHGPVVHFLLLTLSFLVAFGHALPAVASGDSLARAAGELEPPRFRGLRRTMLILTLYGDCGDRSLGLFLPGAAGAQFTAGLAERAAPRRRAASERTVLAARSDGGIRRRQCDVAARTGGPRRHLRRRNAARTAGAAGRRVKSADPAACAPRHAGPRHRHRRRGGGAGDRGERRPGPMDRARLWGHARLDPAAESRGAGASAPAARGLAVPGAVQSGRLRRGMADWPLGHRRGGRRDLAGDGAVGGRADHRRERRPRRYRVHLRGRLTAGAAGAARRGRHVPAAAVDRACRCRKSGRGPGACWPRSGIPTRCRMSPMRFKRPAAATSSS